MSKKPIFENRYFLSQLLVKKPTKSSKNHDFHHFSKFWIFFSIRTHKTQSEYKNNYIINNDNNNNNNNSNIKNNNDTNNHNNHNHNHNHNNNNNNKNNACS